MVQLNEKRSRARGAERALDLPPPFSAVVLREAGDAFAHARSIAPSAGAGTLVMVGRFDLAEFAVVLEPDEPLALARRAFYAGCVGLLEALLAQAPPESTVTIDWPGTIRIEGGLIGGAQLAWPDGAREDAPPDWLVFGAMIRTVSLGDEPGLHPLSATLEDEGFETVSAERLVEGFSRHLMVALDTWQERGFAEIGKSYLRRLGGEERQPRGLADNGDLLVKRGVETEQHALAEALAGASWLDPDTGGPRR
jgi:biotin-(acetyl-CoA carboxylase) ligase